MRFQEAVKKIQVAHEKRFGKSVMPIRVVHVRDSETRAWSMDDENGSACKWDFSAWRIRCLEEREPTL